MLSARPYNYPILPSEGKYSNIKNPKTWSWLVKIPIPVNNRIIPPTFATIDIYFMKLLEKNKNLSIKIPEIIKGIAKPKE